MAVLEICAYSVVDAVAAIAAGADRIELCRAPEADGLTPTRVSLEQASTIEAPVHPIVRPRPAFVATGDDEVAMLAAMADSAASRLPRCGRRCPRRHRIGTGLATARARRGRGAGTRTHISPRVRPRHRPAPRVDQTCRTGLCKGPHQRPTGPRSRPPGPVVRLGRGGKVVRHHRDGGWLDSRSGCAATGLLWRCGGARLRRRYARRDVGRRSVGPGRRRTYRARGHLNSISD